MKIQFHSTVIITRNFDRMKDFYAKILQQKIKLDFGECISFDCGLSIWKLNEQLTAAKQLGYTYHHYGNKNMELCFETDHFEEIAEEISEHNVNYLHKITEEPWGQKTIRFFDPENNLVELGESIPCFVKRFYNDGMSIEEVSEKTSVPQEMVKEIIR